MYIVGNPLSHSRVNTFEGSQVLYPQGMSANNKNLSLNLTHVFSFFRLRRIRVPGVVHVRNVHQNVCLGRKNLLQISLQPFRLRRHNRFHFRSDLVQRQRRFFWLIGTESTALTEDIQSDEVLVFFT